MNKNIAKIYEVALRRLRHAVVYVGVELFRRKMEHENAALKGLPISEFQAHALADLGNFFVFASTRITPDWTEDQVIDAMEQIGWFDEKGLGLLTMKDLDPLIPALPKRKK